MLTRFSGEHDRLRDSLPMIRRTADLLHGGVSPDSLAALRKVYAFLTAELLPHELAEESQLYPALSGPLGSAEAMSPMSRTHAEIQRLIHRLGHHVEASRSGVLAPAEIDDALACLYGLHTLLLLHFAQEEETYFVLGPDTARAGT